MTRGKPFTGWHMTAILVAFFGVVIAVNLFMASKAVGTFSGTVVDNSYVASQKYNGWLAKARAQDALGWTVTTQLDERRHIVVSVTANGQAVPNLMGTAHVTHPVGRKDPSTLSLVTQEPGKLVSATPLAPGRWKAAIRVKSGSDEFVRAADFTN